MALAAPAGRIDAFLESRSSVPLVEARELDASARALVERGRVSSVEPRLGVPTFFWPERVEHAADLRAMGLTPEEAARRALVAYAPLYRAAPQRLGEAKVQHVHDLGYGAVVVRFGQEVQGLPVFRDELKVVLDQRLQPVALSGFLTPQTKVRGEFRLAEEQVIARAYEDLTGRGLEPSALGPAKEMPGHYRLFALQGQSTPARTRKVYFPGETGLVPGFYVELEVGDAEATTSDYFSYVVSAVDGTLLYRKDLTAADSYAYRVWASTTGLHEPYDGPQGNDPSPHPTGTPNGFTPPFVAPELVTLDHGPISTNDPWLAPSASTTQGNNASAYADVAAPDGFSSGDVRATTTAALAFDRVYDLTKNPGDSADQRMAAVTQIFYDVNFFHDWYYDVGFDEAAGNAQQDNYGRGGLGNDPLRAEGQDNSGRNNADMSTPSDGARPRMQMYVFDGGRGKVLELLSPTHATVTAGGAGFGPQLFNVSGEIVLVDDGETANGSTTSDGCSASFVSSVAGKIALVDRGLCTFAEKALNAQNNGAIGVLIANNQGGGAIELPASSTVVTIPVLSLGRSDGSSLKSIIAMGPVTGALKRTTVIDRDGTIDNTIVAHEWGHYISNRLIGDGNGLSNAQAFGMGEGWADFHAMLLVVKGADAALAANAHYSGVYALAAYTSAGTDPQGFYWGIRRLPYSTDFTRNALTFKHIEEGVKLPTGVPTSYGTSGNGNSEAHATGEVWASMLWEVYAALLNDPRYTFEQARDRMRSYLVAAYKITAVMPTFVDARDALLAAASARDMQDFALFSAAFARRGLGMRAVAPDRDSRTNSGVVESFLTGNDFQVVSVTLDDSRHSCDHDGVLDNGEQGKLTVKIKNIGTGTLTQTAATLTSQQGAFTVQGGPTRTFAALAPFAVGTVSFDVALDGMTGAQPLAVDLSLDDPTLATPGPVKLPGRFRVNYDLKTKGSAVDDVESPTSLWKPGHNPNGNTGSDWRRFESDTGNHTWFGPDPASPADTWLTSPPLVVGSAARLSVSFQHRYDFEGSPQEYYDGGVIELSTDDGATWSDIGVTLYPGTLTSQGSNPLRGRKAFVGRSATYPAFEPVTIDLGPNFAGKTVRLRFRIGSDDAAAVRGWEVDDITFTGLAEQPFPLLDVDPNACTNHAPVAVPGADQSVHAGQQVQLLGSATDEDGDAVTLQWSQASGPMVTLEGDHFVAPRVDAPTALVFTLVAFDGRARSAPVQARVVVSPEELPPTVSLEPSREVDEGADVVLTATGVDPGGAMLTYAWVQVLGPPVALTGLSTPSVAFRAPEVVADTHLVFEVTVSNGRELSAPARVDVLVKDLTLTQAQGVPTAPPAKGCGCAAGADGVLPLLGV
ncbi:MAG: myxosortase-dependent M36 family metallopeptidase, partial [Myxococcaceae bacterium]|nr:myxosortase-dependent M36 family metallopeptidase [Myxococcaceae bacterium]